jgi:tRNA A-37 threonylcarbamoyl transferase component Bud32
MSTTQSARSPEITQVTTGLDALFQAPAWDWTQAGDTGWWVRPHWRDALIGTDGLRLEEWRSQGRLTTVKTGPHRTVYRVDLEQGAVYVKHFRVPGFRAKLRQWVRRGKGRNEGRRAARLAQIGVQTITPVALGEQRKRKFLFENYLITHAIPQTLPLDEFVEQLMPEWPEDRQSRVRQQLAEAMAELTAHLHDAGFVHGDFHPGNVLVRLDKDDRPLLAMIDLDALRVRRSLSWADARANLALLNHYFWLRCRGVDRYRFLRAYLEARRCEPPDAREFAKGIEDATRTWAEKLWRRWGRRCRGSNKYFKAYRTPTAWAVASRALDSSLVRSLMAEPDAPFGWPETNLFKDARTTTVAALELPVQGQPTPVIYKRFNRKKWLDPLLSLFRPSRAWRAWQSAQHMASRGLPTPRNLAVIGRAWLKAPSWLAQFLPRETYLITVKAEPSINLADYALKTLTDLDPETQRHQLRRMTRALAKLIRMLHERSLSHRDLKAANILIEGDPNAEEIQLSLIDLTGVQLAHPLPRDRRLQNLARLQVSLSNVVGWSRTDALRFLRAYLSSSLATDRDWKRLWREIAVRCRKKEELNRRRGRALS